ncbi:helix-turn-helix domain-containing protein [uncultured Oscillibacter sp.]|uniref:helix-turn-helix domain-containing protein n=1 Tax=uncultured Oscillibacter sp. TaxID=876091 RepID=UPI0025F1F2A5|nr:helix-turn-helix domain-containing protein [uncultured Oscillibacter sp.]
MTKRPMSFDELPLVLTAAETARFLMVPPSAVYAHMRSGQLKSVRVGKQYRVLKHELLQFLGQGSQTPEAV